MPDGAALTGVGNGIVSVDGAPVIDNAGKPAPYDADRYVYQHHAQIEARRTVDPPGVAPQILNYFGAHVLRGGGGVYAQLASTGLYVNGAFWGLNPMPGLWDVAPDGIVLLCPDYNTGPEAGQGIRWYDPNSGSQLFSLAPSVTGPILTDAAGGPCVRALAGTRVAWIDYGIRTRAHGFPLVTLPHNVDYVVPIDAGGEIWLLERQRPSRLSLRPAHDTYGYVIADSIETWAPDAVFIAWPYIRVGWCSSPGEEPGTLKFVDVDLGKPRTDLTHGPEPDMPPVSAVVKPGRAFAFGTYGFEDDTDPVADIVLPIRYSLGALHELDGREYVVIDTIDAAERNEHPWAMYAGEDGATSCEQSVDLAREALGEQATAGVFAYQDSVPVRESVMAKLVKGDAIGPQCYLNHDESVDAFQARVEAEVDRLRELAAEGVEVVPVVGIHTRVDGAHPDGLPRTLLADAFIRMTELAEQQQWFGMVTFRQGLEDCPPEIVPYLQAFRDGVTTTAWLPDPEHEDIDDGNGSDGGNGEDTDMAKTSFIKVEDDWVEVFEETHQDNGLKGPAVTLRQVENPTLMLRCNWDGVLNWKDQNVEGGPGADEAFIPAPGAYNARRKNGDTGKNNNRVIYKSGPWEQD